MPDELHVGPKQQELAVVLDQVFTRSDLNMTRLANAIPGVTRQTLGRIMNHKQLPTWETLSAILGALHQDPHRFKGLWEAASLERRQAKRKANGATSTPDLALLPNQETMVVSHFETTVEFYSAAEKAVREAREQIQVTYIREYAPVRYANPAAASYFETVLDWARSTDLSVGRIIGMPMSDGVAADAEMLAWLKDHCKSVSDIRSYDARVLEWTVGADMTNLCIIDMSRVFVTFSGMDSQTLYGDLFENARTATNYRRLFDQWWTRGEKMSRYLDRIDRSV